MLEGGRLLEPERRGLQVVEIPVALEGGDDHPVEREQHHEEVRGQREVGAVVALEPSPEASGVHALSPSARTVA